MEQIVTQTSVGFFSFHMSLIAHEIILILGQINKTATAFPLFQLNSLLIHKKLNTPHNCPLDGILDVYVLILLFWLFFRSFYGNTTQDNVSSDVETQLEVKGRRWLGRHSWKQASQNGGKSLINNRIAAESLGNGTSWVGSKVWDWQVGSTQDLWDSAVHPRSARTRAKRAF